MAAKSVSPGAALLRSSRMFSVPAPIPPPSEVNSSTKSFSATATISFPTRLSVTTPTSSRFIGDWGFKRPLPLKTTLKTTMPLVRVRQVDSTEHVTDFQSASDHTMTLLKYQEMHLPLSVPIPDGGDKSRYNNSPTSVFEEDRDMTAVTPQQAIELEHQRWKFKGPWLAGMSDGEIERYLEKVVRRRRPEFRAYLKRVIAEEMNEDQDQKARADQKEVPQPLTVDDVTDAQLTKRLKSWRQDRTELFTHVSRFLDLAPLSLEVQTAESRKRSSGSSTTIYNNPYGSTGPPTTHPSAGLSYLRTRNYQDNHPVYGPQRHHPPIKSRVLLPRNRALGNHREVIMGIAGFVADTSFTNSVFDPSKMYNAQIKKRYTGLFSLDLETRGGAKMYTRLTAATVDSTGKINVLITEESSPGNELVEKENMGEEGFVHVYDDAMKRTRTPQISRNPRGAIRQPNYVAGNAAHYGFDPRADGARKLGMY